MKKIVILLTSMIFMISLVGCSGSDEVSKLMDEEKYEEAYKLIEKNPDEYEQYADECKYYIAKKAVEDKNYIKANENFKDNDYKDAHECYIDIRPKYYSEMKAREVEKYYNEMVKEIEKNPNTIKGYDYFLNVVNRLKTIQIKNEKDVTTNKESLEDIIYADYYDYEDANEIVTELQEVISDKERFEPYDMSSYLLDGDLYELKISKKEATVTIDDVDKYLNNKKITPKTFAYILGLYKDSGAVIKRDLEKIIISWDKSKPMYDYCAMINSGDYSLNLVNDYDLIWDKNENGVAYYHVVIDNPEKRNIEFLSMDLLFYDPNTNEIIDKTYIRVENVKDEMFQISFEIKAADDLLYYNSMTMYALTD